MGIRDWAYSFVLIYKYETIILIYCSFALVYLIFNMRISFKLLFISVLLLTFFLNNKVFSQEESKRVQSMYKLNYWIETPTTFGLFAMNMWVMTV